MTSLRRYTQVYVTCVVGYGRVCHLNIQSLEPSHQRLYVLNYVAPDDRDEPSFLRLSEAFLVYDLHLCVVG